MKMVKSFQIADPYKGVPVQMCFSQKNETSYRHQQNENLLPSILYLNNKKLQKHFFESEKKEKKKKIIYYVKKIKVLDTNVSEMFLLLHSFYKLFI